MRYIKSYEKKSFSVGDIVVCINNSCIDLRNDEVIPLEIGEEYKIEEIHRAHDGTKRLIVSKDGKDLPFDFYEWRFMSSLEYHTQMYNL